MRGRTAAVILLALVLLVTPVLAIPGDRYSYLTIKDVNISLDKGDALIRVNYSIDEGTRLIVVLLGTQDIKNKILKILNYDDAQVRSVDFEKAEVLVPDVAYDYGRGVYWFPDHMFNVVIPYLKVSSPQVTREYYVTNEFPTGMGYFSS